MIGILTGIVCNFPMTVIRVLFQTKYKILNILGILLTLLMIILSFYLSLTGAALMKLDGKPNIRFIYTFKYLFFLESNKWAEDYILSFGFDMYIS